MLTLYKTSLTFIGQARFGRYSDDWVVSSTLIGSGAAHTPANFVMPGLCKVMLFEHFNVEARFMV